MTRKQAKQKECADSYATALSHLTRAAARRAEDVGTGAGLERRTQVAKEELPQWLLDLADAEHSLAVATGHCSAAVRQQMAGALGDLTAIVREITRSHGGVPVPPSGVNVIARLWSVQELVAQCAIHDLGGSV
ncbi:hypothetical protein [Humibacillus xanthopallidus]|uniref:hypothetical protein n=1 Tax=Humibacillus xanthopallidus TaxID=412689 RepID=UPI001150CEA8|nr:hypothetical protein [Humibacillus xanthopallidus]